MLGKLWSLVSSASWKVYAWLVIAGGIIISFLVLLLERDHARSDASDQKHRADDAEKALSSARDALSRQSEISAGRAADIDSLTKERNALAEKDPGAAGDLLSGVLARPNTPTSATGVPKASPSGVAPNKAGSRG